MSAYEFIVTCETRTEGTEILIDANNQGVTVYTDKYVAIDVVKSIYNDGWVQCMHEYAVRTCPNDCYVSTRVYTLNGDRVF